MKIVKQINQLERHIVLTAKRILILNNGMFVMIAKE